MQFYFIRHAQSANNLLWENTGTNEGRSEDPPITEAGVRQAEALAKTIQEEDRLGRQRRLAEEASATPVNHDDPQNRFGFRFTHLYSSPMLRAVQTGSALAGALGLPLVMWKDCHENGGIYLDDPLAGKPVGLPGKPRSFFEKHFPGLLLPADLDEGGWWNRPQEAPQEFPLRAARFAAELLLRHGNRDDRVAIVSHGGFYNYLFCSLFQVPFDQNTWFRMNNCAITRLDFTRDGITLIYANRIIFNLEMVT